MAWSSSNRRARLPKDWSARRARVLARDQGICYQCGGRATEVDHVRRGDDHSDSNLRAICQACHRIKSSREGGTAVRRRYQATRRRPPEAHPGLR